MASVKSVEKIITLVFFCQTIDNVIQFQQLLNNMTKKLAIQNSIEELKLRFDEHVDLLDCVLSEGIVKGKVNVYACSECFYKSRFKEIIVKVIDTLENTKKAFKSKQLEALRRELIHVLTEGNS